MANENGNAEGKRPSYHEQKNRVFVRPIAGEYNLTQELKRLRSLPQTPGRIRKLAHQADAWNAILTGESAGQPEDPRNHVHVLV